MKKITPIILLLAIIVTIVLLYRSYTIKPLPSDDVTAATSSTTQLITTATFLCQENKSMTASFYKVITTSATGTRETGSVDLTLSDGRTFTLPQTISADGGRYSNPDESFAFWKKGNGVLVYENDKEKDYYGCVAAAPADPSLSAAYVDSNASFSVRVPSLGTSTTNFTIDESYTNQVANGLVSTGVKFTIPTQLATGTNLSDDSYLSVETAATTSCDAVNFSETFSTSTLLTEGDTIYSFSSSTDAGAGNRYEELVYALPDTRPCTAVRYFIHYSVFENYASGSVNAFDKTALITTFDKIRRTLIINQ